MGRREDLAAAEVKTRAKVRTRRQQAVGNRRGHRWDGCVGGREDMALGGSGPGAENSVWEGVAPRRPALSMPYFAANPRCSAPPML